MQRERTMKDSGIPWIGEIPEGWKTAYLKHFCKVNSGREIEMESEASDVDAVPVFGSGGVFKYTNKAQFAGEAVMFGRKGTLRKPIYVNERFWAVDTMYYLTFGNMLKAKYCYYQLSVLNWEPYITQTALPSIVATDIVNSYFAFPPLAEQHLIATFLDKKCFEIDSLIELQEQMIKELKAYKQSVITEAVTKGIRNEELGVRNYKDSGIEWIGDVPEEWEVCRIKNVASLFGRIGFRGYTSDDLNKDGEGAITLSPSNMLPMGMDYTNVTYLSWMKYHESPEIMIQDGDILMVKTGSSYGKVSYVDNLPKEATINPQILRIVAKINSKYLGYYLQTPLFIYQVEGGVVGGTIPTISQEKINNFFVVIPPLAEQQAIADYLDKKCGEIDELITIKQQKIESLKEYKKSVIYEYVTGKREV